ncbi:MAG: FAD-binding oxidoreductase [Candidatus Marinimicrobia bacterium]|nr:FAD-binding oxidoreductase [Candidatus Neomarinimicrobiota bacterium]MDP6936396.1 FAD-binding oxidoreductase [Candidatus Neomarinimicrobiota bacterium]
MTVLCTLLNELGINATMDRDITKGYDRDSSNMEGRAELVCRPKNEIETAMTLAVFHQSRHPLTVVAGKTNLTGSATPNGGGVLSMEKLKSPSPILNLDTHTICSPVGIYLEEMRKEVLLQSQNMLHYPVDPTSRNEAMVGGTISCNASGFVPGPQGATRYWTEGLEIITPQGCKITAKRNEHISENGVFFLQFPEGEKTLPIPTYPRPEIKNASGVFSNDSGVLDFVDLIVGSEGIFGIVTSVTFKVKPKPKDFLELFFTLPGEKQAVDFHQYLSQYWGGDLSNVSALEYFGYNCQNYMDNRNYLFEDDNEVGIYLQIPLFNEEIEAAAEKYLIILEKSCCGIQEDRILSLNNPENWNRFFESRHSIPANALEKTRQMDTWSILTDTIVPPENFGEFLNSAHSILRDENMEYLLFGHLGDCHLHFHMIPSKSRQKEAIVLYDKIVEESARLGGVYSAEHGTGKRKRPDFLKCYGEDAAEQIRRCKEAFDPNNILNKGNVVYPSDHLELADG